MHELGAGADSRRSWRAALCRLTVAVMVASIEVGCGVTLAVDEDADADPGGKQDDVDPAIAVDPCKGVPASGVCLSATQVQLCATASGDMQSDLVTVDCQSQERCEQTPGGARCVLQETCYNGATDCSNGSTLRTCQAGTWVSTSCATKCVTSPLGDFCGINEATNSFRASLKYEARQPNADRTDWGSLIEVAAQEFLVVVARTDAAGNLQMIDSQVTGADGTFTVTVPSAPRTTDFFYFMAAGTIPDPRSGIPVVSFAVANPDLAASATRYPIQSKGPNARVWNWSMAVGTAKPDIPVVIRDTNFSAAARLFAVARRVARSNQQRFTGEHKPFVVWAGPSIQWSPMCFYNAPVNLAGTPFASQVFIDANADQEYWSESLLAHELGHYTMYTYGQPVAEGGRHCMGVATSPGQAWSEGYATWYGSDLLGKPVFLRKSSGSMWWADIEARESTYAWPRPSASDGLLQDIYEMEISSMTWHLSKVQGRGRAPIDAALVSPRLRVAPYERGYTRHVWSISGCERTNIMDTGVPVPHFADVLDALRCAGMPASVVDAATRPGSYYPYPGGTPLCRN
jgi:hypothetical protein